MTQDETHQPGMLLLRMLSPAQAVAAVTLLSDTMPTPTPEGLQIATLSDIASDPSAAPLAAAAVYCEPSRPTAAILGFAVAVPFRRRGLARRLLTELSRVLRADGAQRLVVRADPEREQVAALLADAGFVICPAPQATAVPPGAVTGDDQRTTQWWAREL